MILLRFLNVSILFSFLTLAYGCRQTESDFRIEPGPEWTVEIAGMPEGVKPLVMIRIEKGTFSMGAPETEEFSEENERPVHPVTLTHDFYLGKYEVTQAQWVAVMENNPSTDTRNPDFPVNRVSWEDVQEFLKRLNAAHQSNGFRLPSEAEWEYACRAGTTTTTYFGEKPTEEAIDQRVWYRGNSEGELHAAGMLPPNPWGLCDMLGNVWEWCSDWYGLYRADAQTNPQGPASGEEKVFRGASWMARSDWIRCADRGKFTPDNRRNTGGFRVAFSEK